MTLEATIRQVITETLLLPDGQLTDQTNLRTELDVDSLRAFEVIAALEGRWNVMFPEERFGDLVTVNAIAKVLREFGVEA